MAGAQCMLKGFGSFWVFNAQICILPHSKDSFLTFLTLVQHQKRPGSAPEIQPILNLLENKFLPFKVVGYEIFILKFK